MFDISYMRGNVIKYQYRCADVTSDNFTLLNRTIRGMTGQTKLLPHDNMEFNLKAHILHKLYTEVKYEDWRHAYCTHFKEDLLHILFGEQVMLYQRILHHWFWGSIPAIRLYVQMVFPIIHARSCRCSPGSLVSSCLQYGNLLLQMCVKYGCYNLSVYRIIAPEAARLNETTWFWWSTSYTK